MILRLNVIDFSYLLPPVRSEEFAWLPVKITLPNCKLASKNLELPFFPSPEYKKFVFIQAKETTGGVEVSIGVEENTTLVNLQRDSQIWVKSKN